MRVPVDKWIERRCINRGAINPLPNAVPLPRTNAIERNPAVLLPYEMEDSQVSERAPEDKLALRIESNPNRQPGGDGA